MGRKLYIRVALPLYWEDARTLAYNVTELSKYISSYIMGYMIPYFRLVAETKFYRVRNNILAVLAKYMNTTVSGILSIDELRRLL